MSDKKYEVPYIIVTRHAEDRFEQRHKEKVNDMQAKIISHIIPNYKQGTFEEIASMKDNEGIERKQFKVEYGRASYFVIVEIKEKNLLVVKTFVDMWDN